jgi:tRNA dimethylallyltransferase
MGPTASGKTDVAIELSKRFPVDLISVDSALVYRDMNVGTAKPDPAMLQQFPHALIDILEPEEFYSAGEFIRDATSEIDDIHARGRVPLMVGGTMMYFRTLINGMAELPPAVESVRAVIDVEAEKLGWPALHAELAKVDPEAAARINPNDSQRIQRALEVYRVSDRTLTDWHQSTPTPRADYRFLKFALIPEPRALLHARIEERLDRMLDTDFIDEVHRLRGRPRLTADHPSMRAVGYRQIWAHLEGDYERAEARERALAATRQLAKRQLTWLRSEQDLITINPLDSDAAGTISTRLESELGA